MLRELHRSLSGSAYNAEPGDWYEPSELDAERDDLLINREQVMLDALEAVAEDDQAHRRWILALRNGLEAKGIEAKAKALDQLLGALREQVSDETVVAAQAFIREEDVPW